MEVFELLLAWSNLPSYRASCKTILQRERLTNQNLAHGFTHQNCSPNVSFLLSPYTKFEMVFGSGGVGAVFRRCDGCVSGFARIVSDGLQVEELYDLAVFTYVCVRPHEWIAD